MDKRADSTGLDNLFYYLTGVAIFSGFFLTIYSWIGTCESCGPIHQYRLFHLDFEWIGIVYFLLLIVSFILSRSIPFFAFITGLVLASGLGSEIMFIQVQKYGIGSWCPICLGIAGSLLVAVIAYSIQALKRMNSLLKDGKRRDLRRGIKKSIQLLGATLLGCVLAFIGISKINQSPSQKTPLKNQLVMGNTNSTIELYTFTSWVCPACKKFEPGLEKLIPDVWNSASLVFIDYGDDVKTLNFLPFHLSFMQNNKSQYIELRQRLKALAETTDTPTNITVQEVISSLGVLYKQPAYADLISSIEYFKELVDKFKITSLPSVVILNRSTKKSITLTGSETNLIEINEAIQKLNN